jgi:hypothetical protein
MARLVRAIHDGARPRAIKSKSSWMAGTSPAMTYLGLMSRTASISRDAKAIGTYAAQPDCLTGQPWFVADGLKRQFTLEFG